MKEKKGIFWPFFIGIYIFITNLSIFMVKGWKHIN